MTSSDFQGSIEIPMNFELSMPEFQTWDPLSSSCSGEKSRMLDWITRCLFRMAHQPCEVTWITPDLVSSLDRCRKEDSDLKASFRVDFFDNDDDDDDDDDEDGGGNGNGDGGWRWGW